MRRPVNIVWFDGSDSNYQSVTDVSVIQAAKNSFIYVDSASTEAGDISHINGGCYKVFGNFSVTYGTN